MNNFKIKESKTLEKVKNIAENCVNCGLCQKACLLLEKNPPKEYFKEVLKKEEVDATIPYSCTTCDLCKKVCPKNLDIRGAYKSIREDIVKQNKVSPIKGHKAVRFHQKLSFSSLFSYKEDKRYKTLFMPGCSLSAYSPEAVIKVYDYLKTKYEDLGIVLLCCGKPLEAIGEKEEFNNKYKLLEQYIEKTGAVEIITACQSCFSTIKKNSPNIKVKSLWRVISEVGVPFKNENMRVKETFAIHDSCATRYEKEIQESIRDIMKQLNLKVEEMKSIKENTRCCGSGGMAFAADGNLSQRFTKQLIEDCTAKYIVTYCASCRETIMRSGKESYHILDLIFSNNVEELLKNSPAAKISLENWIRRFNLKGSLKKRNRIK